MFKYQHSLPGTFTSELLPLSCMDEEVVGDARLGSPAIHITTLEMMSRRKSISIKESTKNEIAQFVA